MNLTGRERDMIVGALMRDASRIEKEGAKLAKYAQVAKYNRGAYERRILASRIRSEA